MGTFNPNGCAGSVSVRRLQKDLRGQSDAPMAIESGWVSLGRTKRLTAGRDDIMIDDGGDKMTEDETAITSPVRSANGNLVLARAGRQSGAEKTGGNDALRRQ